MKFVALVLPLHLFFGTSFSRNHSVYVSVRYVYEGAYMMFTPLIVSHQATLRHAFLAHDSWQKYL
jgi:hypothetical protein